MEFLNQLLESIDYYNFEFRNAPLTHWTAPFFLTTFYVLMVLIGPKIMENRKPIKGPVVKKIMFWHNIFLCVLSLIMAVGIVFYRVEYFNNVQVAGNLRERIFCDFEGERFQGPFVFWLWLFYVSKFYEFLDTFFQIICKRQFPLLHSWHHFSTAWLVWFSIDHRVNATSIDSTLNALVHVVMYFWYAQSVIGNTRHPAIAWIKPWITRMQIVQFVLDLTAHGLVEYSFRTSTNCGGDLIGVYFGHFVILSFLVLFIKFYRDAYTKKKSEKKAAAAKKKEE